MRRLVLVPLLMLTACMMSGDPVVESAHLDNGNGLSPTSNINHLSQRIVNSLVKQNDALRLNQPVLVATPVMLESLDQTNALGLQLQQGMISALHSHQFSLVDVNVAENMKVTPTGDFILTRDWQQLSADISVEHVIVSTMSLNNTGVVINARVVDVTNNRVVSATQASVMQDELPNYIVLAERVTMNDGLLYRDEKAGLKPVIILGDRP